MRKKIDIWEVWVCIPAPPALYSTEFTLKDAENFAKMCQEVGYKTKIIKKKIFQSEINEIEDSKFEYGLGYMQNRGAS